MKLRLENDAGQILWEGTLKNGKNGILDDKNFVQKQLVPFLRVYQEAILLFIERFKEYGNTWDIPEFPKYNLVLNALVCLVKEKRICKMLDQDSGQPNSHFTQIGRNALDVLVYGNFFVQLMKKYRSETDKPKEE